MGLVGPAGSMGPDAYPTPLPQSEGFACLHLFILCNSIFLKHVPPPQYDDVLNCCAATDCPHACALCQLTGLRVHAEVKARVFSLCADVQIRKAISAILHCKPLDFERVLSLWPGGRGAGLEVILRKCTKLKAKGSFNWFKSDNRLVMTH